MKKRAKENDEPSLGIEVDAPGSTAQNPLSISTLTTSIRDLLEENFGEVWLAGEISNFRSPGSGHLYFTLKDEGSTLAAVMFMREARRVGFALQDGMAVLVRGSITVYEARGQYQIQVAEVRPRGQGSLQQRFEELKRRLTAEGLFETDRKRDLPVFPETIGIVTSLQGAVLQDMLNILRRRAPGIRIQVRGVRVQGPGSAQEVAEAIGAFSAEQHVDLLVVARGGGSLEDLWSFNEEVVARALAACSVPTISAIGHETDFTIADFTADLRAPTPSAAAELLTRDWAEWREEIAALRMRLDRITRQQLAERRRHLGHLASSYALREPRRVVRQWAQRLDDLRENLQAAAQQLLQVRQQEVRLLKTRLAAHHPARELARRKEHLVHLAARLRALGPQATLDRGYALVLDPQGHPLTQAAKAKPGEPVRLVLSKGSLDAAVTQVHPAQPLIEALKPGSAPAASDPVKQSASKRKSPPSATA